MPRFRAIRLFAAILAYFYHLRPLNNEFLDKPRQAVLQSLYLTVLIYMLIRTKIVLSAPLCHILCRQIAAY